VIVVMTEPRGWPVDKAPQVRRDQKGIKDLQVCRIKKVIRV